MVNLYTLVNRYFRDVMSTFLIYSLAVM